MHITPQKDSFIRWIGPSIHAKEEELNEYPTLCDSLNIKMY